MSLALLLALSLVADDCPGAGRLARVDAVLKDRPTDATLHYWRATALAQCGRVDETAQALATMRRHGDGFLPTPAMGFAAIWSAPAFKREYTALERALPKVVEADVRYTIDGARLIPEGIAFDAESRTLYLGSIATGSIVATDGKQQRVFAGGLAQVLGLAFANDRLYAVNTSALVDPPASDATPTVVNEVVVYAKDGRVERRLAAEGAAQLNDVAVTHDGTIYATDSGSGSIYCAKPGDTALAPLVKDALAAANGLAWDAEHDQLFVAHATGIVRMKPDGSAERVTSTSRETIGAIDGLYLDGDTLVGIQNATNPGRVIAMRLDDGHASITNVTTLLSHHHRALDEPTTGAIAGDEFLVLANSHVAAFGRDGRITAEAKPKNPVILALDLPR